MSLMTVAICAYNGAAHLPGLVAELRRQNCPVPFEIVVIDNNSSDSTGAVAAQLAQAEGAPLRVVKETQQGIPYARNRAIEEAAGGDYLAFIDVDEIPAPGWLAAAVDALEREQAQCVGGEIRVRFPPDGRPDWLGDELLGFLGELNHGPEPLWVGDRRTPVWSGNIAYRSSVFADGLRFDHRYNRAGKGIGGGSDGIMFRTLLQQQTKIRYRPDMLLEHHVEPWRLKRAYFLRLHFIAGRKFGEFEADEDDRGILGVPPYMVRQMLRQWGKTAALALGRKPGMVRQAMNAAHATGAIKGRFSRWRNSRKQT